MPAAAGEGRLGIRTNDPPPPVLHVRAAAHRQGPTTGRPRPPHQKGSGLPVGVPGVQQRWWQKGKQRSKAKSQPSDMAHRDGSRSRAVEGSPLSHSELVEQIKRLQRQSHETRMQWWHWCEVYGGGWRDPKRHQVSFLQGFLDAVETNTVPQAAMQLPEGAQTEELWWLQELVNAVKEGQRQSPEFKRQWWAFCDRHGSGVRDPGRHRPEFVEHFLAYCPESHWFQPMAQWRHLQVTA
mmetsp:Transcript_9404/g.17391  ORF Transcript_9404/g.17391 Transcript_9404/m.17391 type:complete len:238 (-) Transcript_9404:99-812(-)